MGAVQAVCNMEKFPVVDLHCDLLSYLNSVKDDPWDKSQLGCAIPFLKEGNVKLQVLAIYSDYQKGAVNRAIEQTQKFQKLLSGNTEHLEQYLPTKVLGSDKIQTLVAIENATGFSAEEDSLDQCFRQLENLQSKCGPLLYIGITHHYVNRFGGGNYSGGGLTEDGKVLLEYLSGKGIAIDFAHASDALARGVIDHIDKKGLDLPIMASHSNFRKIMEHPRNLPDDIALEVIKRGGLIGINFLRDYINPSRPEMLLEHIQYGWDLGGAKSLAFGADFFYTLDMPDKSRIPFFFKEHEDASKYPNLLSQLKNRGIHEDQISGLAYKNALEFIQRNIY